MISGGYSGAWAYSKWVDYAWMIGYYELYWLSKLGDAAIAALSAFAVGKVLAALRAGIPVLIAAVKSSPGVIKRITPVLLSIHAACSNLPPNYPPIYTALCDVVLLIIAAIRRKL